MNYLSSSSRELKVSLGNLTQEVQLKSILKYLVKIIIWGCDKCPAQEVQRLAWGTYNLIIQAYYKFARGTKSS